MLSGRGTALPEAHKVKRPRAGRPPAGESGERVADYPTVRIPPRAVKILDAIASFRGKPRSVALGEIVVEYLESYLLASSPPTHREIQNLIKLKSALAAPTSSGSVQIPKDVR
jgi:hypothetical protein